MVIKSEKCIVHLMISNVLMLGAICRRGRARAASVLLGGLNRWQTTWSKVVVTRIGAGLLWYNIITEKDSCK